MKPIAAAAAFDGVNRDHYTADPVIARKNNGELPEREGAGLLSQGRRPIRRGRSIRPLSAK